MQQNLAAEYNGKSKNGGMRSRWCRELQRRCGSKQLWEVVSFSGRWDPKYLEEALSSADSPDPLTAKATADEQAAWRTAGANARARLRLAMKFDNWRQAKWTGWTSSQQRLLKGLDDGSLLEAANAATRASGHGRLHAVDGSYRDIGGSTGGFTRKILDNFAPQDYTDMNWD